MIFRAAAVLFGLSLLPAGVSSLRADTLGRKSPKQSFEVTTTEKVPFPPGGAIHLEHSYGYLSVEGWDEPEVEVTVTKSTDYFDEPDQRVRAEHQFDQVRVVTERRSDKEVSISTAIPARNTFFNSVIPMRRIIGASPLPRNNKRGITLEYRIHAPHDSSLVIHHDNGYVWVSDLTADIEINRVWLF